MFLNELKPADGAKTKKFRKGRVTVQATVSLQVEVVTVRSLVQVVA